MPMMIPNTINRQPRTMRSRRIRKNLNLRALRIDRIPSQMLSTNPIMASMIATWTAACMSNERDSKSNGRFTAIEGIRLLPGYVTIQCLQFPPEHDLRR